MTKSNLSIRGIYRDVIHEPGRGVVHDSGWTSNTIVTRCRVLLASFVKNEAAAGIHHLAVGQGDVAWDVGGIPPSDPDATTDLVQGFTPAIAVSANDVVYLDEADDVQETPSSQIQVSVTLPPGYPTPVQGLDTYPLREFGLFGQLDGADYMINSIRHPVIHKNSSATLIRVVRLYF